MSPYSPSPQPPPHLCPCTLLPPVALPHPTLCLSALQLLPCLCEAGPVMHSPTLCIHTAYTHTCKHVCTLCLSFNILSPLSSHLEEWSPDGGVCIPRSSSWRAGKPSTSRSGLSKTSRSPILPARSRLVWLSRFPGNGHRSSYQLPMSSVS